MPARTPGASGIRAYIARHRLGNTQTDDLWRAVEEAARRQAGHRHRPRFHAPAGRAADPRRSAACASGQTQVALRQGEFSRDRTDKAPQRWRVPVIAVGRRRARLRTLLDGSAAQLPVPGCGPVVVNGGQPGYFRTLYSPALLGAADRAAYAALRPIDQIGLLADNWALGLAGYQPASAALDMLAAAPADANPAWPRDRGVLGQIHGMYDGDRAHQAMVARSPRRKLAPALHRLGWSARGPASRATTPCCAAT